MEGWALLVMRKKCWVSCYLYDCMHACVCVYMYGSPSAYNSIHQVKGREEWVGRQAGGRDTYVQVLSLCTYK